MIGLDMLILTAEDLDALARQGFVAADYRGDNGPYYKLRWRIEGRQRVRYLGRDPVYVEAVREALAELQQPLRATRSEQQRIRSMFSQLRRSLRDAKSMLMQKPASASEYYHGYTIRRRRTPSSAGRSTSG